MLSPVPGRMACYGGDNAPSVVVDYAHTPDAQSALGALRAHLGGQASYGACLAAAVSGIREAR